MTSPEIGPISVRWARSLPEAPEASENMGSIRHVRFTQAGSSNLHDLSFLEFTTIKPTRSGADDEDTHIWIHIKGEDDDRDGWIKVDKKDVIQKIFQGQAPRTADRVDWTAEVKENLQNILSLNLNACSKEEIEAWNKENPNKLNRILREAIFYHTPDTEVCQWMQKCSSLLKGQAGKNLLQAAIQSGNPLFVKELLSLNVSPNVVYGLPLDNQSYSTTTPIHQAVAAGYLDIVKVLIDQGAQIDAKDAKGNTVVDLIRLSPPLSKNMNLRRLVESKLGDQIALKKERFHIALEETNWPEVLHMIEREGYIPTQFPESIVSKAIQERQGYLVQVLIEKGIVKKGRSKRYFFNHQECSPCVDPMVFPKNGRKRF